MTTTSRRADGSGYGSALRVAEFDALAGSSFISIVGDSAAYLALTVLVYQRTASPLLSALTFAVAFLPYLFGGTLLGALVDRLRPKHLLVGFDLVGAVLVGVTAVPGVPIPLLYVMLFLLGTMAPVRSGTTGALVAEVLSEQAFVAGRSIQRIAAQTGQIAGSGVGGILIAGFGPRGALVADTASFALSATLITIVLQPRPQPTRTGTGQRRSLVGDSLAGVTAVWSHPAVRRLLLLSWTVPFVSVFPEALSAPAVAQSGHRAAATGVWLVAIPIGTVIGDLAVVWAVPQKDRHRLMWPLAVVLMVLMLVFAAPLPLPAELALLAGTGTASAYALGLDQLLRSETPDDLLARMFTLSSTGLMVVQGLGFAVSGALAQLLQAHTVIAVAGAGGLIGLALIGLHRPATTGKPDRPAGDQRP